MQGYTGKGRIQVTPTAVGNKMQEFFNLQKHLDWAQTLDLTGSPSLASYEDLLEILNRL